MPSSRKRQNPQCVTSAAQHTMCMIVKPWSAVIVDKTTGTRTERRKGREHTATDVKASSIMKKDIISNHWPTRNPEDLIST